MCLESTHARVSCTYARAYTYISTPTHARAHMHAHAQNSSSYFMHARSDTLLLWKYGTKRSVLKVRSSFAGPSIAFRYCKIRFDAKF